MSEKQLTMGSNIQSTTITSIKVSHRETFIVAVCVGFVPDLTPKIKPISLPPQYIILLRGMVLKLRLCCYKATAQDLNFRWED